MIWLAFLAALIVAGVYAAIRGGVSRRVSAEVRADRAERDLTAATHRADEIKKAEETRRETDRGSFDRAVDDL